MRTAQQLTYVHGTTDTSPWQDGWSGSHTHQIVLRGSGSISATVIHEATNDPALAEGSVVPLVTLSLTGGSSGGEEFSPALLHNWRFWRTRCTTLTAGCTVLSSITGEQQ